MDVLALLTIASLVGVGWAALVVAGSRDRYRSRDGRNWPFGGFLSLKWWAVIGLTFAMLTPGVIGEAMFLAPGETRGAALGLLSAGVAFSWIHLLARWLTRFGLPREDA